MNEEEPQPALPPQPLEYASPGPKKPANLKILGITFAIPLGFVIGLVLPLLVYSAILYVLTSVPASITVFFVCVGGAVCAAVVLAKKRITVLNVFMASLFIGATITILILSACGFH